MHRRGIQPGQLPSAKFVRWDAENCKKRAEEKTKHYLVGDEGKLGFLYRIFDKNESSDNGWETTRVLHIMAIPILKATVNGWTIPYPNGRGWKMIFSINQRYACKTLERAIQSFEARKGSQIALLERQLKDARQAQRMIADPSKERDAMLELWLEMDRQDKLGAEVEAVE